MIKPVDSSVIPEGRPFLNSLHIRGISNLNLQNLITPFFPQKCPKYNAINNIFAIPVASAAPRIPMCHLITIK